MSIVELMLVQGYPSSTSLGNPNVTDLVPTTMDFLNGVLTILDESGETTWRPTVAPISGTWIDSATMTGRQLVAMKKGNVIEDLQLMAYTEASTTAARAAAIVQLNRIADAAANFWAEAGASNDPVYLRWRGAGAPGEQYALISTIEVDVDMSGLNDKIACTVTLSIEREPSWRPLPPGSNPKIWAFQRRGLKPSSSGGVAPIGMFNYNNLSLIDFGGAAAYRHQFEATIYKIDEPTTNNINYIDIPASACLGDAPVRAMIHGIAGDMMIGRSTIRDLYPLTNYNAGGSLSRMRNTYNAASYPGFGGVGVTLTGVNDANNGVWNPSLSTRQVLRVQSVAAGHVERSILVNQVRPLGHYNRRWKVFMRARMTAGNANSLTVRTEFTAFGVSASVSRNLLGLPTNSTKTFYVGDIDATAVASRGPTGLGLDQYAIAFNVYLTKSNDAVASTLEIADFVLMPADEPTIIVGEQGIFQYADTTGYFSLTRTVLPDQIGQEIFLVPGVNNRIYFMPPDPAGAVWASGATFNVSVNLLPCWYGMRDE